MTGKVEFSVLMPLYSGDDPELFRAAVESVLQNSVSPSQFLIVVDGPIGFELELVLDDFSGCSYLEVVRLPDNVGLANCLNYALENLVRFEYVIRADADDFNAPERFAHLCDAFNLGFDLVGSYIEEVDIDGSCLSQRLVPTDPNLILSYSRRRSPFNHMSVGYRRSVVLDLGGYPDLYLKEDYGLWAKFLVAGFKTTNLPLFLVSATTGKKMFSRRGGWKYFVSEFYLQRYLAGVGLKPVWLSGTDFLLRGSVFLAPNFVRQFVYLRFLR